MRLDKFLFEYDFVRSRTLAQDFIKKGFVFINNVNIKDNKFEIDIDLYIKNKDKTKEENQYLIEIRNIEKVYVSRGAYKLLGAIEDFNLNNSGLYRDFFTDKICLDIGSSTGGFTEVLLDNNVKCVYAVDVGKDQFDKNLLEKNTKSDSPEDKINLFENTDIRDFSDLKDNNNYLYHNFFDIIVSDISFISLYKVLPDIKKLLKVDGYFILLLKPQFELENKEDRKKYQNDKGVIKDEYKEEFYNALLEKYKKHFANNNLNIIDIKKSHIRGGDGNEEFLVFGGIFYEGKALIVYNNYFMI